MKIADIIVSIVGMLSIIYGVYLQKHNQPDDSFAFLLLGMIFLTIIIGNEVARKVKELLKKK